MRSLAAAHTVPSHTRPHTQSSHTRCVRPPAARARSSLKKWKISLYAALGYRPEYVVEAGGHAGSTIERLSVKGMVNDINAMSPTGLSTALRYARGTAGAAAAELDYLAFRSTRQWLAELGLAHVPRTRVETWASLKLWATQRATTAGAPQPDAALFIMHPSTPEPELDESVEVIADTQNAHTHTAD